MTFRVATYNLHFGGVGRVDSIIQVIKSIDADAVLLVEASNDAVINEIAQSLRTEQVSVKGQKSQLALLSKRPITSCNHYYPEQLARPLLAVELTVSQQHTIGIYGLHLQCHYFRHNEQRRVLELKTYLRYIKSRPSIPHIMLGDFNAIAPDDHFDKESLPLKEKMMLWWERDNVYRDTIAELLSEGYSDCFKTTHPNEDGFTLPSANPHVRLDYIFADRLIAPHLLSCDVVRIPSVTERASDHLPVVADFDL